MTKNKTGLSFLGTCYFLITPILFYTLVHVPSLDILPIILSLLVTIFLIKGKFFPMIVFMVFLFISSEKHLSLEGNQISSINTQRNDHQILNLPSFTAKFMHNKFDYLYTVTSHAQKYFSLSTIFSAGSYPNQINHIPLPYLFPWDIFLLIPFLKNARPSLRWLIPLSMMFFAGFLPWSDKTTFYFVIPPLLYLKFGLARQFSLINLKIQYLVYLVSFIYTSYYLWFSSVFIK